MERQKNRLVVLVCDRRLGLFAICSEDLYHSACERRRETTALLICGAHAIISYIDGVDDKADFRLGDPRLMSRIPDEGDGFLVEPELEAKILQHYREELASMRAECEDIDDDYLGLFEAVNVGSRFAAMC